jgi:hypothetical protein
VVPYNHGVELNNRLPNARSTLWVRGAGHNDIERVAGDKFWGSIDSFLKSL